MKFLFSLFFTILFIINGFSQENSQAEIIQKLETLYLKSENTSTDIDQMITLCDELSIYNPELSLAHLKKIKPRMKKIKDLKNVTYYCSQLTRNYITIREFDKGLQSIDELYEEYKDDLTSLQEIHFKIARLTVLEPMGNFDECLSLIAELLPQTEKIERKDILHYQAVMYNIKGAILSTQRGKYKEAVASYLQALRVYKQLENEENNIAMTHNRLGLLYENIEDYPKSISYYLEGIRSLENRPPKSVTEVYNLLILYSNLGNVYKKIDLLDKALYYQNKALKMSEQVDSPLDKSRVLYNMGSIYLQKKEFYKALEYIEISQEMCRLLKVNEGLMHNYLALGEVYLGIKKYTEAKKAYDSVFVYVKNLVYPKGEVSIYQGYANLYKELGDYKNALKFHTLYYDLEKGLIGLEKQEAIAQLEVEYETELKDEEIKRISYEYDIKKAQNQKLILGIILLFAITGGIIFFLIYRNRTLKDLYNRNIELMNSFKNKSYIEKSSVPAIQNSENNDDDNLKMVFNKLVQALEKDKIYTDPELTLSKLASAIKSNEKYVSAAISTYTNMNYNSLINSYRIHEAKLLIYENNGLNINEVMYESGFNSRTTFYDSFKKHTGMSPKQFKDMKGYSNN